MTRRKPPDVVGPVQRLVYTDDPEPEPEPKPAPVVQSPGEYIRAWASLWDEQSAPRMFYGMSLPNPDPNPDPPAKDEEPPADPPLTLESNILSAPPGEGLTEEKMLTALGWREDPYAPGGPRIVSVDTASEIINYIPNAYPLAVLTRAMRNPAGKRTRLRPLDWATAARKLAANAQRLNAKAGASVETCNTILGECRLLLEQLQAMVNDAE